jgi:TolA-binding protein
VLLGGCFASKADIRLLQDDIATSRAQQAQRAVDQERARARGDSLARVQADSAIRVLGTIQDSLRALSRRFLDYQAGAVEDRRQLAMQITTLQNRVGISQRQIQNIAAQRETSPPPVAAGSTSTAADSGAPALPGPARLFQMGRDLYNQRAYATARMTFRQILTSYPDSPDLANVAVMIGVCYEAEANLPAADSVYQSVVREFPASPSAATALYKSGSVQAQQKQYAAARAAWERVLKDYPTSTEAQLVPDRLKALPGGG